MEAPKPGFVLIFNYVDVTQKNQKSQSYRQQGDRNSRFLQFKKVY